MLYVVVALVRGEILRRRARAYDARDPRLVAICDRALGYPVDPWRSYPEIDPLTEKEAFKILFP